MRAARADTPPRTALSMEWLLGNGLGDFAAGTAMGAHVRMHHAHLTVAGADGRPIPLLLKLDSRLIVDGRSYELGARPNGPRRAAGRGERSAPPIQTIPTANLIAFRAAPEPTWRWRVGDVVIEKRVFLVDRHHAVVAVYRHVEGPPARLAVSPVVGVAADEDAAADPQVQTMPGRVRVGFGGSHALTIWHDAAFLPTRAWHDGLDAAADPPAVLAGEVRGFVPGLIEAPLADGAALHVLVSAEEQLLRTLAQEDRLGSPPPRTLAACVAAIESGERDRITAEDRAALAAADLTARQAHVARHPGTEALDRLLGEDDAWTLRLARALRMSWVERGGRRRFVDSLPTADESGTSALRAVRALVTLRDYDAARDVLCTYGQLLRDGLAPSGFDADGKPRYDDVVASLWLVTATELYARRANDHEFVRRALFPALEQVMERIRAGGPLGLRVDDDALLVSGEGDRAMKRADVNALWYQAQVAIAQLAKVVGRKQHGAFYLAWAREHQARERIDVGRGRLPAARDRSAGPVRGLEPSQLWAAARRRSCRRSAAPWSLPIERELFTPLGLREAPGAPRSSPNGWVRSSPRICERTSRRRGAGARARVARRAAHHLATHAAEHLPVAFELSSDAALDDEPLHYAGDPVSAVAAAELLRAWVEELDHAGALAPS
jgi:hypothetical protein